MLFRLIGERNRQNAVAASPAVARELAAGVVATMAGHIVLLAITMTSGHSD